MTNDGMEQSAAAGSIAIQSQRDTNIGLSAEEVIKAIASHIPAFGAIAREIVEARCQNFEEAILRKIADQEARLEAFGEPGFVKTLHSAQTGYSISDDPKVGDMLVDLISKRSLEDSRTRKSLSLDHAVEVAGNLTKEEFAELALCFLFRYTRDLSVNNVDTFSQYLNGIIDPFIDDISLEDSAYTYLEAQKCATISIANADFRSIMVGSYAGLISKGLEISALSEILPSDPKPSGILIPCLHNPGLVQLDAVSRDGFDKRFENSGVPIEKQNALWAVFENSLMTKEEIQAAYGPRVPNLARFIAAWDQTQMSRLQLTSVGIAIGHTNATRMTPFSADLNIWIK